MSAILRFFLSLKTASALFLLFMVLAFSGSLVLPGNLAFFSGIDDTPLFRWLADNRNIKATWWIYLMIIMLAGLAVSTVFCTAEGLLKGIGRKNLLRQLSPQIMHAGVLLIMLGHLLTASIGFKTDILLTKGQRQAVTARNAVYLEDLRVHNDKEGYITDWEVQLKWISDGKPSGLHNLKPVHPLYFGRFGIYSKSADAEAGTALIRVCNDPGAAWALIGGLLLCAGGLGFLYGRSRSES